MADEQGYMRITREQAQELWECGVYNFQYLPYHSMMWYEWGPDGPSAHPSSGPKTYVSFLYRVPVE